MTTSNIKPINLPTNASGMGDNIPEEIKKKIFAIRDEKIACGEWDYPLDFVMDPANFEYIAYYLHKSYAAYKVPRKGSALESYFKPFLDTSVEIPNRCGGNGQIRLSASGDLMFASLIEESRDHLYSHVESLIFDADYSYVNLESTLAEEDPDSVFVVDEVGGTPEINITREAYKSLITHKSKKFNLAQLANNHIMDSGEGGCLRTIAELNNDRIDFVGVHENGETFGKPKFIEVEGIKIAWIAFTYSLNWKPLPDGKPWMVNVLPMHTIPNGEVDLSPVKTQVRAARESGVDLVFVSLHWGLENETYPHPEQLEWSHALAESGADAIIGHHSHCSQPYEIYQPESFPGKYVPILYGLGNLTPGFGAASTCLSLIANFRIAKPSADSSIKAAITGLNVDPVLFVEEKIEDKNLAAIVPMKELWNMELDEETGSYVEEAAEYADLVVGKSWRS